MSKKESFFQKRSNGRVNRRNFCDGYDYFSAQFSCSSNNWARRFCNLASRCFGLFPNLFANIITFIFCPVELIEKVHRAGRHVILKGNRNIWFKSADNPDSLRSQGVKVLWVDEGAQISEEAWTLTLRPSLIDQKGIAFFTGTPRGHNCYFQLWTRGQNYSQTNYKSLSFPSVNNPYLDPLEIDSFAHDMPELAYRQEVLREFLEDVGSVFRVQTGQSKALFNPMSNTKSM